MNTLNIKTKAFKILFMETKPYTYTTLQNRFF